jgi:NAD(P)-dependent dehydrogenase (short-subunit alcohol dehydrogenase family)
MHECFTQSFLLLDKWFLVTGAASGIGKAVCLKLLELGASVYATDINETALQEIYKSFGKQASVLQMLSYYYYCCYFVVVVNINLFFA